MDLAVDALLADAARDELRVLRAEVEDEDELAGGHAAPIEYQPRRGRQATRGASSPRATVYGSERDVVPDLRIQVARVGP